MKTLIKRIVILFFAAFLVAGSGAPDGWGETGHRSSTRGRNLEGVMDVNGAIRTFRVHLPPGLNGTSPVPLVIVLHGGGGNGVNAEIMTGFSEKADREKFIVVYPDGSGFLRTRLLTWNSGNCCGYALAHRIDDVGFISRLIDKMSADFAVDRKRVFVTGMSNGGMMAHSLACRLPDKIAAIAPVAGALNVPDCSPSSPVAALIIHGTEDRHVLYGGGRPLQRVDKHDRVDAPVRYGFSFWGEANRCNPPVIRHESGRIIREHYSDCPGKRDVVLYTIVGGGHVWPPGRSNGTGADDGENLSATDVIWDFFKSHGR